VQQLVQVLVLVQVQLVVQVVQPVQRVRKHEAPVPWV